ncbi:MAG: histidine kinase [Bacteroidales bacterium]
MEFRQKSPPHPAKGPALPPFVNTFIISVLIIGFDTGIRMMIRWSKLEQEKTLLEKENAQNQLAFLRNQVSPHFFMNTLNNIHALIDLNSQEAKDSIIKLSKLMRYLLYDSDAEFVSLKKEMDFITSYINLMRLRFSDKVNISLQVPDNIPNKLIPPYLFISFVENAFKHGISYQNLSYINIDFSLDTEHLTFEIKNSVPELKKENKASGIGLENSKKRLDILYGKKYSLNIEKTKEDYKLTLIIPV